MYMLDTDICSYIIRENPASVLENLKKTDVNQLHISVVTQAELYYGAALKSSKKINKIIVDVLCNQFKVLDWDNKAASCYGDILAQMKRTGKIIGVMDTLIAAHALSIGATIVTNNTRHFDMVPDLKVVNWV